MPVCEPHSITFNHRDQKWVCNSLELKLQPQHPHGHPQLFVTMMSVHIGVGKRIWLALLMGPCLQLHLLGVYMIGSLPNPQGLPVKLSAIQQAVWIHLSPPPYCCNYKCISSPHAFHVGTSNWSQVLILVQQAFNLVSHFSRISNSFSLSSYYKCRMGITTCQLRASFGGPSFCLPCLWG